MVEERARGWRSKWTESLKNRGNYATMFNTSQSKKGLGQEAKNKEREQGMQGTRGEVLVPPVCPHTLSQVCALNT